jgi:hypothetical protein
MDQIIQRSWLDDPNWGDLGVMKTAFGLEREKIRATLDKRPLARAIALAVETLRGSITTDANDFWVNTDLVVNVRSGRALDKTVTVNVYAPLGLGSTNQGNGMAAVPPPESRIRVEAQLEEKSLAWAMAWVIRTIVAAVKAEQEDFWVNIDLNVHIRDGKAKEKKARINVYGDLLDSYDTTILDAVETNVIPEEILRTFCKDFGGN